MDSNNCIRVFCLDAHPIVRWPLILLDGHTHGHPFPSSVVSVAWPLEQIPLDKSKDGSD